MTTLHVYPMHGYHKWLAEGFRTRDAHLTEWFSKLANAQGLIDVHSRPDPIPMRALALRKGTGSTRLERTIDNHRNVLAIPSLKNPKYWWKQSVKHYRPLPQNESMVIWNPMLGLRNDLVRARGKIHFDLLDDWTVHQAFSSIREPVVEAYGRLFQTAHSITANSEGTLKLAHRYGRSDAVLMPNGCDPERFSSTHRGVGRTTVGYVGKIGSRLDGALIGQAIRALPCVNFVFAGPVLEKSVLSHFSDLPNVSLLGDVHYSKVPELLQTFDIGWVPHGVETGQVGGDAIKIYEYRAAGLPVLTTPIIGTRERPMVGVNIADAEIHVASLQALVSNSRRVPRIVHDIPEELTWRSKANHILSQVTLG